MTRQEKAHNSSLLDEQLLKKVLKGTFSSIEIHDKLANTNERAMAIAQDSLPALVVCEEQCDGRGRQTSSWMSSKEKSLTFSIAINLDPTKCAGLSLAVAVAVSNCLRDNDFDVYLKWPNDLLSPCQGKLGGILVEISSLTNVAVLGVGLNLKYEQYDQSSAPNAKFLSDQHENFDRNELLIALAIEISKVVNSWREEGMQKICENWLKHSIHKEGDILSVSGSDGTRRKVSYLGLAEEGELLVSFEGRQEKITSAEVILESACN